MSGNKNNIKIEIFLAPSDYELLETVANNYSITELNLERSPASMANIIITNALNRLKEMMKKL